MKEEVLKALQEKMQTLDPDQQESYKFLGVKQADGIKTREVYESAKEEVKSRINITYKVRT